MCRYENPRGPNRRHLGVRIGQDGGAALFVEQALDGTVVVCAHTDETEGPVFEFTLGAERWHASLLELRVMTPVKKQVRPKRAKK